MSRFFSKPAQPQDEFTGPVPLETGSGPMAPPGRRGWRLSLFWRTFFLLALLLLGSIVAWLQTFRALEFEPRAIQTANQIASLVNLSRAALVHADAIARISLLKTLAEQEGVQILPREGSDRFVQTDGSALSQRIAEELQTRLGRSTAMANTVNGKPGLWVGFNIDGDEYWLLMKSDRFTPVGGRTWMIWLLIAAALSLAGAALIARLINRPLKELSFAASRLQDGDFEASRLDEGAATSEIREVNIGFNRMAEKLSKIEQDRAVMLAGISHDLRTPLARLRLETELSVADITAREHMAADIEQLDAIIGKFLDYARPDQVELRSVFLNEILQTCIFAVHGNPEIRIQLDAPPDLHVMADPVELTRIVGNLIENARRYGKTPETGVARIHIAARVREDWVLLKIRDHGMGVSAEMLPNLTKPFFRGDAARTAATGAGLGLAIVDKTIQRMGGTLTLTNASSGGLAALIKLQKAAAMPKTSAKKGLWSPSAVRKTLQKQ